MSEISTSVVIPTYNSSGTIARAIESALRQTHPPVEVIVIDDGSTDDTRQVLEAYISREDIRYIFQPNSGAEASPRNRGISASRGNYIAFLDADDIWYLNKLERINEVIEQHPIAALYHSDALIVDDAGEPLFIQRYRGGRGSAYSQLLRSDFIVGSSVVVKKTCFEECGLFYETLMNCSDWDMWIRISRRFPILHVPDVLVEYVWHTSVSSLLSDVNVFVRSVEVVFERAVEADPDLSSREKSQIWAAHHYLKGRMHMHRGKYTHATHYFAEGVKAYPLLIKNWLYWIALKSHVLNYLPKTAKRRLRLPDTLPREKR